MLEEMTPSDLGLSAIFADWRPIQKEAIECAVYGSRRFNSLAMPTGSGKSLTVMSIAKITNWRTVILTGTKGLMDQYMREFGEDPRLTSVLTRLKGKPNKTDPNRLVDIRGKSNYRCLHHAHVTCEDGQKMGCRYNGSERCCYQHSLTAARNSQIVVTNYKYWMHINRAGAGLCRAIKPNPVEHLVLDEAHLAPEELAAFLSIRLGEKEISELLSVSPPKCDRLTEWVQFAKEYAPTAKLEAEEWAKEVEKKGAKANKKEVDTVKRLESLHDRLDRLRRVKEDGWVCEQEDGHPRYGRRWEFDPIWPGMYAEKSLFCGVPHITLISATLRPKTMGLLGVKHSEFEFREWPRVFPANRSPIYHVPTIRLNYRTDDIGMRKWVDRIDEIIGDRLDRKGIIHTVSYSRQEYLMQHSRFAHLMIGNTSDPDSLTAAQIVHEFKQAAAPCILVSPSFSTGWDFPGDECEWAIIGKVPIPPARSKVMRERVKRDPQYTSYLAMQDLIQSCGRGMRSEKDRCEVFIVDDTIGWFLMQNRALAPKWFDVRRMAAIPAPPKSLFEESNPPQSRPQSLKSAKSASIK